MTTPPPPLNLTGTSPTSDTALLNWSSPPMVVVANYRVYRDGKYLTCTHDTNFVDTGLQPGTSYNYGIDDVAGDGGASLKSTITVVTKLDNVPPSPPTNVVATAVGPQSISVSWVNADVIDTNAAATEVDLELDDTTSGAAIPVTLSPDSIDYEFDGLAIEDTYTCAVWAYNNNGTSMRVVSNAVTLPIPLPVAITGPATATASDSATVTGTIYANGYPYPNAYFIWSDGNTTNQTPSVNYGADAGNLGQSASATLTGLQPNTTYSYQLVADNNDLKSYGDNLSFTIQATTQYADLSISATVSPKYTVGQSVSIPITVVRSGGQLPSSPGTVTVALYGPTQSSFNPAATPSWTGTVNTGNLNSGGTAYELTATFTISSSLSSGAYNIFAVVDPANQYVESNKNNNVQTQIVNITQAVTVTVISPAGGATWNLDDSVTISWTATDPDKQTGYFEMDLSTDGGVNYSKISGWTLNTSVGWKVANVPASNACYIKVVAFDQTQNQLGFGTSGKFTIQSLTPIVTTGSADITATPITISGTVNPNGLNTSAYFMWGLTSGYGNSTSVQTLGNGTSALPITASMPTSLLNGTTYHYTIVATNSSGSSIGNDQTFTPGQETGLPDLTISFSGVGTSYPAGGSVPISITVNKAGGYLPAGGTVTVALYLSFSPTIYDAGDLVLSSTKLGPDDQFLTNNLNSHGSQTMTTGFQIPSTDAGTFYLIAVVDPANQYNESNINNNTTPGQSINIAPSVPPTITVTSPAFVSSNIPPTWYLGDTQTITWSASDPSNQIAAFSIYLSTDGGITYPQLITNSTFAVSDYYNYNWVVANTAGSGFSNNCMIEVVALDAGGNFLASGNSSGLIIAHKPSITAIAAPTGTYHWGDAVTISWAVNDPDKQISSYSVRLKDTSLVFDFGTEIASLLTTTSMTWTVDSPDNPAHNIWNSNYAVDVVAWDIQNNNLVSDVTSSSSFTIAPITMSISPANGYVLPANWDSSNNVTFSWSIQNDANSLVSSFNITVEESSVVLFQGNVAPSVTSYSVPTPVSGSSANISVTALDSKGYPLVGGGSIVSH